MTIKFNVNPKSEGDRIAMSRALKVIVGLTDQERSDIRVLMDSAISTAEREGYIAGYNVGYDEGLVSKPK